MVVFEETEELEPGGICLSVYPGMRTLLSVAEAETGVSAAQPALSRHTGLCWD